MIICASANPAIDRRMSIEKFERGGVNRVRAVKAAGGGKSAHVALALRALDVEQVLVGFFGGATGVECETDLWSKRLRVLPIRTSAVTRVNLEIIEDSGAVTEFLEPGGPVCAEEGAVFLAVCRELFHRHSSVVLAISGSVPTGLAPEFYCALVDAAHEKSHQALIDTSGPALHQVLCSRPDLVKVNRSEASTVLGRTLHNLDDTVWAARQLQAAGARSVAISCGADGLVALMDGETEARIARVPAIATRSAVGCGDATLAGFAAAYSRNLDSEKTLRLAVACGAANCLAPGPGQIETAHVNQFLDRVQIGSAEGKSN